MDMKVVCVKMPRDLVEKLRDYADAYFGGFMAEAVRYAIELLFEAPPKLVYRDPVVDEETGMVMLVGRV